MVLLKARCQQQIHSLRTSLTDGQTVQITGTTLSCPSNSNSIITAVNPIPVIGVSSTDIDNVFCADASVDFTASGADNYEFIVDGISQGPSSTTNTINSTGFNTGTYNIDIIGEQSNCISSTSISITVNGFPTANLVSSDLDNIICEGEAVTFTGSGGDLFQFEINGISQGTPSPVDNITFNNLTHNDVVSVIATSVDGCTNELALYSHNRKSKSNCWINQFRLRPKHLYWRSCRFYRFQGVMNMNSL